MAEAFEAPATMDELVKKLNEAMGDGGLTDLDEKGLARVQALMASYTVRLRLEHTGGDGKEVCPNALKPAFGVLFDL